MEMLKFNKFNNSVIELFYFIFILLVTFNFVKITPPGPDSYLYFGLAENLIAGSGFFDNIRNDEILPSIGHPAVIAFSLLTGVDHLLFAKLMIVVAMFFFYKALKNVNISLIFIPVFFIFIFIYNDYILWGVEISIVFSYFFLLYSLSRCFVNFSLLNLFIVQFAVLFCLLVRPLLFPLLIFLGVFFIFKMIVNMNSFICLKKLFLPIMIFLLSFASISWFSYYKYGDNRYFSGTYSAIPLYAAWNPYIDLEKSYHSKIWDDLDPILREEALKPLVRDDGWKKRDKELKNKSIEFVFDEPLAAALGYIYRFKKYSISSESKAYRFLIYFWLIITFFISINIKNIKYKTFAVLSVILPIYFVVINSFFVYAGFRYSLVPIIFFLSSIAWYAKIYIDDIRFRKFKKTVIL